MFSAKWLYVHCFGKKEHFLLPLTNNEAAAKQNIVSTLARNSEAHEFHVQMQVRQLEHEADARCSQRQMELLSRFSQQAIQALEDQGDIRVTEVTSEVSRRDEQVHDLCTVFQHTTRKKLRNNKISRIRWTTSAVHWIVQETPHIEKKNSHEKNDVTEMIESSRTSEGHAIASITCATETHL